MGLLPAVVSPGPVLSAEQLARYSRQLALPGLDQTAQRRLANARVLVIGAGGLGSAAVPYLASCGVGTIGIVDDDVVELSNLHRQVAHGVADIGRPKTASLADAVHAVDPGIHVVAHDMRVTAATMPGILAGYDVLVDGSDNFAARYLSSDAAQLAHKPLVWGAILRFTGEVSVSWADAGPTYRDLYPVPPAPGDVPSCAQAGVIPGVCAVIGGLMATEVVKLVTGLGEPLIGRVTTYDALTGRFREVEFARDPQAAPVTRLVDYDGAVPAVDAMRAMPAPVATPAQAPSATRAAASTSVDVPDAVTPQELAELLNRGDPLQLVDVREDFEAQIVSLPGAELIPLGSLDSSLDRIRTDVPVVVYCHLGGRSAQAARVLRRAGYDNVIDLLGGIEAYAAEVDTALARY